MLTKTKHHPRKKKLLIIISVIAGVLMLAGSWLFYFQPRIPHPLGDQLEYIGKRDYGCAWFCGSLPGTTYIYATNLTPPELVAYFQNAQATQPEFQIDRWQNRGESFDIELLNVESAKNFFVFFEAKPDQELKTDFGSAQITQKYVVRIDSDYYGTAKDSL